MREADDLSTFMIPVLPAWTTMDSTDEAPLTVEQQLEAARANLVHAYNHINALASAHNGLVDKVVGLQNEAIKMRAWRKELQDRPFTVERPREPKFNEPEEFHGDRSKFTTFRSQLFAYFSAQAAQGLYLLDEDRFRYATGRMRGNAYNHVMLWVDSLLTGQPAEETQNFGKFLDGLATAFGPIDAQGEAIRKMLALKQTQSVDAYANAYRLLIPHTGYNMDSILRYFEAGLKDSIKVHLVGRTRADSFEKFVREVAQIESDMARLKSLNPLTNPTAPKVNTTTRRDPNDMEVDRLDVNEFNRRKREGLCFTKNCASKDHMTKDCPKRKKQGARVAKAQVEDSTAHIEEVSDERTLVPVSKTSLDQQNAEAIQSLSANIADLSKLFKAQLSKGF